MPEKTIPEVLEEHTSVLMAIPEVVGVGQGFVNKNPVIKVFVTKKTNKLEERVPEKLGGYSVVIEETGEFKASTDANH